ncbi:unnamed protein product [Schistocephalus solidus]|uniref:Heterogeneous nuclear ribonucleoprotein K n=1 Tax=Schistocephalus solidus TaxID=70667 RepID=A0A183TL74_SCHSO|nr:unnamed protein product [Schistocephalus solidus]
MKRENGSSDGPSSKFRRSDTSGSCLRVLIPSRAAGPIIGKGGETIKKLRIRLHIPDSRGPERAKDSDQRLFNGRDEDGQEQNVDPEKLIDLRILIHQSQVGSVIGKKGDRIKELKNDNNMHLIKIYQELAPCSTDRVVQLIGEPEGVASCVGGIMETLEASPIRGPRNDYDANYWDQGSAPYPSGSDRWSAPYYDAPPPPPPPGYVPSRGYDSRPPSTLRMQIMQSACSTAVPKSLCDHFGGLIRGRGDGATCAFLFVA